MSHFGKLQTPLKKRLAKHLSSRTEQNSLSVMVAIQYSYENEII